METPDINEYESDFSDYKTTLHQIEQQHQECYGAILKIAKTFCRPNRSGKYIAVNAPMEIIDPAIKTCLVTVEDGHVNFKDQNVCLYAFCKYLAVNVLLRAWKDNEKLYAAIRAIYLRGYEINCDSLAARTFEIVHNEYKIDIIKRIGELCNEGKDFWNFLHAFAEALPRLKADPIILIEALGAIEKVIQNDLAGIEIYDSVEKLSELQPDTGESLYRAIVEDKLKAIGFIPCTVRGMSKNDFGQAYDKATALLESDSVDLIGAGIIALGRMDYHENSRNKYLQNTLANYEKLKRRKEAQIIASIVKSYGRLMEYTDESKESLVQLSERKEPEVLYEMASVLFLNAEKYCGEQWFSKILLNIADIDGKYAGIVQRIDDALSCIEGDSESALVISFWETWVVNRDYGNNEQERLSVFKHSVSKMISKCFKNIKKCFTLWLNADDHRLNLAASDLVREICHRRQKTPDINFELDKDVLDKMSHRDIIYIIYKILGYVSVNPDAMCSMVFSTMRSGVLDKIIIEHIVATFRDYIAYNYPGITISFLKEFTKSKNQKEADIANRILNEVEVYYGALNKLKPLPEFEPPPQRVQLLMQSKAKQQGKEINQSVREKSVFLQLCKEITIKAGSSFFVEQNGKFTGKTELKPFSYKMEFPRGELIDPVGQSLLRLRWRNLKREEFI